MAQFTNRASLIFNNTVINSNVAVGEVSEVLSATKTAVASTYASQDTVTYAVSLINDSDMSRSALVLRDDLGAFEAADQSIAVPLQYVDGSVLYYVNGVLQPSPAVDTAQGLVISGIDIPARSNAMVIYSTTLTQYAPLGEGASITNTATLEGDGVSLPVTAEESIGVREEPILSITKSISPIPVAENGRLSYTFTVINSGNQAAVATDDIILTDIFDPILSNLTVTFNGAVWTEGVQYTYDSATGEFETTAGAITVDAASFTTAPDGSVSVVPSVATLVVTATI